jgi:hypothetical protein
MNMTVNRKDVVLRDVAWSFIGAPYADRAEFEEELREAQDGMAFNTDELVVLAPTIQIEYEFWERGKRKSEIVMLQTDDGHAFSAGERMLKLHNAVVVKLGKQDHHFFEGLKPVNLPGRAPLFSLWLGS